jgi:hypothetical protein
VCYKNHVYSEPAAGVGQAVPVNIHQKLVDASQLASIAYCTQQFNGDSFTCNNFCSAYVQTTKVLLNFDASQLDGIPGYIAVQNSPTDPRIIVAFKGTDPKNILQNDADDSRLNGDLVDLSYFFARDCVNCMVTAEANKLGNLALNYLSQHVADALDNYPCYRLQIIGHSLGGVMAELVAAAWKQVDDLEVITFAQPRVGNAAWASYIDSILASQGKFYRVTHRGDPVVLLPDTSRNFRHHQTEYWIDDTTSTPNSVIVKCNEDEDPNCADSQPSMTNWQVLVAFLSGAHTNYLMPALGKCDS